MTVLGIDPSTDKTGVALVAFDRLGHPRVLLTRELMHTGKSAPGGVGATDGGATATAAAQHVNAQTARLERIRATRAQLLAFLADVASLPAGIDLVAYELAWGTRPASVAVHQATGAYLCVRPLAGLPVIPVTTSQVKAAYQNQRLAFAPNADAAARSRKRVALKANAVEWARQTFGLALSDGDDAIADALAVATAAESLTRRAWGAAATRPLFGSGSHGGKVRAAK